MQKYIWSTALLMSLTSLATYFAATYRSCPNCRGESCVLVRCKEIDTDSARPLPPSTQSEPFMIEPIEPIVVEPEPRCENPIRQVGCEKVCPSSVASAAPQRMPYADEHADAGEVWALVVHFVDLALPYCGVKADEQRKIVTELKDCFCIPPSRWYTVHSSSTIILKGIDPETGDANWWRVVREWIGQFMPSAGALPADPGIETPNESAPPVESKESSAVMPMADYHHKYPSCPYMNGCPPGCPFPPPAYLFDRTPPN